MHRIQENISRQFSFSNSVFNENDDKLFENLNGKIEKRDLLEFLEKKNMCAQIRLNKIFIETSLLNL